jgi:hypothetical protein
MLQVPQVANPYFQPQKNACMYCQQNLAGHMVPASQQQKALKLAMTLLVKRCIITSGVPALAAAGCLDEEHQGQPVPYEKSLGVASKGAGVVPRPLLVPLA